MNKYWYIALGIVLTTMAFALFLTTQSIRTIEVNSQKTFSFNDSLYFCLDNFHTSISILGEKIPVMPISSKGLQLTVTSPVLVFRITESQCDMCIDKELFIIRDIMPELRDRIIVLGSYSSPHSYTWRMVTDNYYIIPINTIPWKIEEFAQPYYFILDSNLRISNIYISHWEHDDLSRKYLRGVKKILLNGSN